MTSRLLGVVLSLNRAGFGLTYMLRPAAGRAWIGRAACDPATTVIMRGHGARDLALGCGALLALARGDQRAAGAWIAGQVVADAADFAATFATRQRLPKRGVRLALLLAGFGSATGSVAAIWLASGR